MSIKTQKQNVTSNDESTEKVSPQASTQSFLMGGRGVVFAKTGPFLLCHFIYRYIQDEMLENVILVILRRNGIFI